MKKIRVLQFPMANAYGGITQYALQNWRYIDKTRFQFDFVTLCKDKLYFEDEVATQGCKVYHISCYAEENKEQFSNEIRAILANGYDIVHLHTSYWKSFLVEELAKEAGIPRIIVHAHNSNVLEKDHREERKTHHMECVENLDESLATDYWACSWSAARWLYGEKIPNDRIVIQKNAIDIEKYRYQPNIAQQIKKDLGWENNYIIGHVGRFTYQKNHEFLIRVFRKVHEMNPDTRLLMIGVGPERDRIENMIFQWHIQDAVQILEKRNDVYNLMQTMDCFVLPSLFEGLAIVAIEAQASGCECILSDSVTEEAVLTETCRRIPLIEDLWIGLIKNLSTKRNMPREHNAEMICKAGYDIHHQIKKLEENYANGFNM